MEHIREMKVVAGLGAIEDYIDYVNAGADEVFIGYVPYYWLEKYGIFQPLNRREVRSYNVSIGAYTDLCLLKKMEETYRVPVKIALNSLYYTRNQYTDLLKVIKECMEAGFYTFIVGDPALLIFLMHQNLPISIHVSGEMGEVNQGMMQVWDTTMIKRFIFHRKVTIDEMNDCILAEKKRRPEMEYEAFVLNEMCHFTGAYCNSLHCDEFTHMCRLPYRLSRTEEYKVKEEEQGIGSTGCGLCALYPLNKAGVTHLKVVGRGNDPRKMQQDIKGLKRALSLLKETTNEGEFQKRIMEIFFPFDCSRNCYYR